MQKSQVVRTIVDSKIMTVRLQRVMLDRDLAEVYGVTTKALNQAVKRNAGRFPKDFCFRLKVRERDEVVTNCDHLASLKFSAALPFAFTEHGAIMAATVLNSALAVEMSVFVVRAFVRFRELAHENGEIAQRLSALEKRVDGHDDDLVEMFGALRQLLRPPDKSRRRIGFASRSPK
jgi:ORF6N domain